MMKRFLMIVVLGLLCFNSNAIAEEHKFKSKDIKGFKKIRISMHNKKVNRIYINNINNEYFKYLIPKYFFYFIN